MIDLFISIINMSISASWLILAVLLFRWVLKKASKSISILLWILVSIRLVIPYSFESIFCIIPSTQTLPKDVMTSSVPYIQSNISIVDNKINPLLYENSIYNTNSIFSSFEIMIHCFMIVWMIGIVIFICYYIYSFYCLREKTKLSLFYKDNIYYCEDIDTPFVFAVLNPKIYLPIDIEEDRMEYVLAHENMHIHRKDYIWKIVATILHIVHWFNPLVWLANYFFNIDLEMSIDELVVKEKDASYKKKYCESLIFLSNKKKVSLYNTLAFGEGNTKTRITNIVNYTKPSKFMLVISIICFLILVFTCMSEPIQSNEIVSGKKINEITDWESYDTIFDNIEKIEIGNVENSYTSVLSKDIDYILDCLSQVSLYESSISQSRSMERDKSYYVILQSKEKVNIYFSHDLKELWIYRNDKVSLSYRIKNSEVLNDLFFSNKSNDNNYIQSDVKIVSSENGKWLASSITDENILYEIQSKELPSIIKSGDRLRITYKKENIYFDSMYKINGLESAFYLNDVEIIKKISEVKLFTYEEIQMMMETIIKDTPSLQNYSYVELYYDEQEALTLLNELNVMNKETMVIFANLKASSSLKNNMSNKDGKAYFIVNDHIQMNYFYH